MIVQCDWVIVQCEELHGVLLNKHHAGYQIKKNQMGGARSTCGGWEKICRALVGNMKEKYTGL